MDEKLELLKKAYKRFGLPITIVEKESEKEFNLYVDVREWGEVIKVKNAIGILIIEVNLEKMAKSTRRNFFSPINPAEKFINVTESYFFDLAKEYGCKAITFKNNMGEKCDLEKKGYTDAKERDGISELIYNDDGGTFYYKELEIGYIKKVQHFTRIIKKTYDAFKNEADEWTKKIITMYTERSDIAYYLYFKGKNIEIKLGIHEDKETFKLSFDEKEKKFKTGDELKKILETEFKHVEKTQRIKNVLSPPKKHFNNAFIGLTPSAREQYYNYLLKTMTPHEIEVDCVKNKGLYQQQVRKRYKYQTLDVVKIGEIILLSHEEKAYIFNEKNAAKEKAKEIIYFIKEEEAKDEIKSCLEKELA